MNQRLHVAYDYMADKNSGMLSPVGIGFEHVANDGTSPITHAALYTGDGSHPSIYGSYLAACCFYEIIFETNSEGNTFVPGGISDDEATYLQEVAHHVLTEVDSINIDYTNPIASYTVSYDGLTASFTNTSEHAFEYFWEFGDGETSTEENPTHTYPDEGPYEATLTAIYCDREDEVTGGSDISGIRDEYKVDFTVYPNPSHSGIVNISYSGEEKALFVFGADGGLVLKRTISTATTLNLKQGIYLLKIGESVQKIIVQ